MDQRAQIADAAPPAGPAQVPIGPCAACAVGALELPGYWRQHLRIVLDGALVISRAVVDFAQIKLRVSRLRALRIELDDVAEFLAGQIVFRGVVIARGGLVELVDGRRLRRGG